MAGEWKRAGGTGGGGFKFEGWGQLAASRDGRQVAAGDGAIVVFNSEPTGMWRIKGGMLKQALQGSFQIAQFRDVVQPDPRTIVVRYRYQMFHNAATEERQVAFRSRDVPALAATLTAVAAQLRQAQDHAAAEEAADHAERDADPRGAPLTADELRAIEALMGPAVLRTHEDREAWRGDSGEMEDCTFVNEYLFSWDRAEEACRWEWASYWFIEMEDGCDAFCTRCLRNIIATGELPDGIEREADYDDR